MIKKDKMTHDQKIQYMRIATGIVGYGFDERSLDMFISIYELVIKYRSGLCRAIRIGNTRLPKRLLLRHGVKPHEHNQRDQG